MTPRPANRQALRLPFVLLALVAGAAGSLPARAESPLLPPFGFPDWIKVKAATTTSDTRATQGAAGQVVCELTLTATANPVTQDALEVKFTATWKASTKQWTFAPSQAAGANVFGTWSFPALSLSSSGTRWSLSGTLGFAGTATGAASYLGLTAPVSFLWDQTGFAAHLATPITKSFGSGISVSLTGVALTRSPAGWSAMASGQLTLSGATIAGTLELSDGLVHFSSTGPDTSNAITLGALGKVRLRDLSVHYSGTASVSGNVVLYPAPGTPAAQVFGAQISATLAADSSLLTLSATFPQPVRLDIGGGAAFAVSSTTVHVPLDGKPVSWTGQVSLQASTAAPITGELFVSADGLSISHVQGLTPLDDITVSLAAPSGKTGTSWSASFDLTLSADAVNSLYKSAGAADAKVAKGIEVSGSISAHAVRISFKSLPPLPMQIPDWLPLKADAIKEFAITKEFGPTGRVLVDFSASLDLSSLPGFSGVPAVSISGLFGKGVSPPPMPALPGIGGESGGAAPAAPPPAPATSSWFAPALSAAMPDFSQRFSWFNSAGGNPNLPGFAFGPLDPSVLSALPGIQLPDIGALKLSHLSGGGQGGKIFLSGHFGLAMLQQVSIGSFTLDNNLDLDFAYDGQALRAAETLAHDLPLPGGLDLSLKGCSLTRGHNDAGWTFTLPAAFGIVRNGTSLGSLSGSVTIGKSVTLACAGPASFALSPNVTVAISDVSLTLGSACSGTGTVKFQIADGTTLSTLFKGKSVLAFKLSVDQNGYSISTTEALPTIHFPGGVDSLTLTKMSIAQSLKTGALTLQGDATLNLSGNELHGDWNWDGNTFSVSIDGAGLVDGLDAVHLDVTLTRDTAGNVVYVANVSGALKRATLEKFYRDHGFGIGTGGVSGDATVSGSVTKDTFAVDIRNVPAPQLPGSDDVSFDNLEDLSVSVDRAKKTATVSATGQLTIKGVVRGMRVTVTVLKTAAATSPDLTLSISADKPPSASVVDVGSFTFTRMSGGRSAGLWSVTGEFDFVPSTLWTRIRIGTWSVPGRLHFTFTFDKNGFVAMVNESSVKPDGAPQALPGIPLVPTGYQLRYDKTMPSGGLSFGILCALHVPKGDPLAGIIGFAPDLKAIQFKITDPKATVSLPILDLATKKKLADITISNFALSMGDSPSVSGTVTVNLPPGRKNRRGPFAQVLGTDTLQATLSGSPTALMLTATINSRNTVALGHLGNVTFDLVTVAIGSDGTAEVTGKATIPTPAGNRTFDLFAGMKSGEPFFGFKVEGNAPLELRVKDAFDFRISGAVTFGANMLGFATMSLEAVHLSLGAAGSPFAEFDTTNFVYYLPNEELETGFVFFDSIHGYMNVEGFQSNLTASLPDPLSSANAEAVLEILFAILSKDFQPSDFDKLKAPAFGLSNVYLQLPKVPGTAWDPARKAFVPTDDVFAGLFKSADRKLVLVDNFSLKLSTLLKIVATPFMDPKAFAEQVALELFEAVKGSHALSIGGMEVATAEISIAKGGFHSSFKLDAQIPPHNPVVKFSSRFSGNIGQDGSWSFGCKDDFQIHSDGWQTVEKVNMTLSSKDGFSFSGSILGATGTGTVRPDGGFDFTGHLDSKGKRSDGVVMDLSAGSDKGLTARGRIYVNEHKVVDGKIDIEDGKASFTLKPSVKEKDLELDARLHFKVGLEKFSVDTSGSVTGKLDVAGIWIEFKDSGEFSLEGHILKVTIEGAGFSKKVSVNLETGAVTLD